MPMIQMDPSGDDPPAPSAKIMSVDIVVAVVILMIIAGFATLHLIFHEPGSFRNVVITELNATWTPEAPVLGHEGSADMTMSEDVEMSDMKISPLHTPEVSFEGFTIPNTTANEEKDPYRSFGFRGVGNI